MVEKPWGHISLTGTQRNSRGEWSGHADESKESSLRAGECDCSFCFLLFFKFMRRALLLTSVYLSDLEGASVHCGFNSTEWTISFHAVAYINNHINLFLDSVGEELRSGSVGMTCVFLFHAPWSLRHQLRISEWLEVWDHLEASSHAYMVPLFGLSFEMPALTSPHGSRFLTG